MSNLDQVDDPELQAALDAARREYLEKKAQEESAPDPGPIRYVFSRDTSDRQSGDIVKVRNGLDEEPAGGTIIRKIGAAYLVKIDRYGLEAIVHEPDDSWV